MPKIDSSIEQINSLLRGMPKLLYRYSTIAGREDRLKSLIVDSELYCVSPSKFNDPLDCQIPFVLRGTKQQKREYLRNVIKRQKLGMRAADVKKAANDLERSLKTKAGKAAFDARNNERNNSYGIVSLSKHPDNMLMWSYYADSHKGIAIRFNMDVDLLERTSEILIPIEMQYEHEMPENNLLDIESNNVGFITTAFGTKSKAWDHEDEWRLVSPSGEGVVNIPTELIDGIILGMNISDEHERLVKEWIELRSAPVELFRVTHKRNSFDLEVVPV